MKIIDTSTFNFPEIVRNGFLYVDKTACIWNLVGKGKGEFFLSRPRRFGKSLLVSTLKALFQGKRELFKGLAIDKKDYDWKAYPVIHLDFASCQARDASALEQYLNHLLNNEARAQGMTLRGETAAQRFENLINDMADASENGQVVVLVDEYDKPILGNVTNDEHREGILAILKGFYSCIKKCEGRVRFALITGVSKFSHVSLFSGLNNLTDLTLNRDYAALLGFTEAEIRECFADRIPEAAKANGLDDEALMERLLRWYDGYRFSNAETHVCNPVSVSKFFNEGYEFSNYWGSTGAPSFLFDLAKRTRFDFERALSEPVSELVFGAYELDRLPTMGLLWQTGYLTIKEVMPSPVGTMYRLGFPDLEVEQSFNTQLLGYYSGITDDTMSSIVFRLMETIRTDDLGAFMETLQAYFASIPYDIRGGDEHYYQTIFFVTFLLLGCAVAAEARTNAGRIDAYVQTQKAIYIFEFKLNKSARKAVGQIVDRRYYERFQAAGLPIRLVGVNFDSAKGRVTAWKETTLAGA